MCTHSIDDLLPHAYYTMQLLGRWSRVHIIPVHFWASMIINYASLYTIIIMIYVWNFSKIVYVCRFLPAAVDLESVSAGTSPASR